jgi:hypothetical protein
MHTLYIQEENNIYKVKLSVNTNEYKLHSS